MVCAFLVHIAPCGWVLWCLCGLFMNSCAHFSSSLPLVPGVGGLAPGSGGCAAGDPTAFLAVSGLLPVFGLSCAGWTVGCSTGLRARVVGVVPAAVALSLSSAAFKRSSSAFSSDAWLLTMRFLVLMLELKSFHRGLEARHTSHPQQRLNPQCCYPS